MRWRPGERERWLALEVRPAVSFERTAEEFLATAPDDVARALLADWRPSSHGMRTNELKVIVARFGMAAHAAIGRGIGSGIRCGTAPIEAATPYVTPEIARRMADVVLLNLPGVEYGIALAWLRRNVDLAARTLDHPTVLHRLAATGAAERDAVLAAGHVLPDPEPVDLPRWADDADDRDLCGVLAHTDRWGPHPAVHDRIAGRRAGEYGWELFRRWSGAGWPTAHRWALHALGVLGDDETARRLAPRLPRWHDRGRQWARNSRFGVDVLARIGTHAALVELQRLAEDRSRDVLSRRAAEHLHVAAVTRGLADEQLTDALVLGPDVELRRLERAMAEGRRWSGGELRALILAEPSRSEPARRLVWAVYSGDGVTTFRPGDPHVDARGRPVRVADDAGVGIVHPLDGADLAPWAERLAADRVVQPFPQLSRPDHGAPADLTLSSLPGTVVPAGAVPTLLRRGWRFHALSEGWLQCRLERRPTRDDYVVVTFHRGLPPGRATILDAELRADSPLAEVARFELMYDLWQAVATG
jgi:hypothetical protein